MLREELPKRCGGRISVTLASWPERNLTGPELLRVLRAGQIDLGGIALPTVAGDAPLLDIIDLAGLLSSHAMGRKVADAVMPEINKELERFNVRIIATYPFPAQVFFCRDPITVARRREGPARPHAGRLAERLHPGDRRRSRSRSASRKSIRRSSAASSIAPSPAPRPATARAGTR